MKYIYLIIDERGLIKDGNYSKYVGDAFSSLEKAKEELTNIWQSNNGNFVPVGKNGLFSFVTYKDADGVKHIVTIEKKTVF